MELLSVSGGLGNEIIGVSERSDAEIRSPSTFTVFLVNCGVEWSARKQSDVSLSKAVFLSSPLSISEVKAGGGVCGQSSFVRFEKTEKKIAVIG